MHSNVQREQNPIPSIEHILAQLGDVKVFSKLDTNLGFWQITLEKESAFLTTFITSFKRFHFNRILFGITTAQEYFQKRIIELLLLQGLSEVVCMVGDILVYGQYQEKHNHRLTVVLKCLEPAKVTLNNEKWQFFY